MALELTPDQNQEHQQQAAIQSKHSQMPTEVPGYDAERWLGDGAFGTVWVAQDKNTGRKVAIKFFTRRGGLDWALLTREVEKLRVLSNDRYVVQLLEVGWESSPPYYVMEYVEGGSLNDHLGAGPMPVAEAVPLFRETVLALTHAHNKGILHCDLKPANILLDQDRRPRLADFGQARLPDETSPALGTWFYMAPEQADLKAAPDARWDVYALGAILYCMLTGEVPYRNEEFAQRISQSKTLEERLTQYREHIQAAIRPKAHRRVPGVDRALADIVDRCLAKDPSKRFANVQAVLGALDARALNRARRPLLALGAVGPALLLVIMSLFAWRMMRVAVEDAQEEIVQSAQLSNRITAELAAQAVGDGIRKRRTILDVEASKPELADMLKATEGQPPESESIKELQAYIDKREQIYRYLKTNDNWFIVDATGRLLDVSGPTTDARDRARANKTLGKYFWDRDFFHGMETNLTPYRDRAAPADIPIIRKFHQSIVFQSSTKGTPFIVTFSMPIIKEGTNKTVGILAMAVRLAGFSELHTTDQLRASPHGYPSITLVQSRELKPHDDQWSENVRNGGLILEHPGLRRFYDMKGKDEALPLEWIDPAVLEQLRKDGESLDYRDPFGKTLPEYQGRYMAAVQPVKYDYHTKKDVPKEVDTGWLVIVQASYESAIKPVLILRRDLILQGLIGLGVLIAVVAALWMFVAIALNDSPRSRLAVALRRRAGLSVSLSSSSIRLSRSGTTVTPSLPFHGIEQKTNGPTPGKPA